MKIPVLIWCCLAMIMLPWQAHAQATGAGGAAEHTGEAGQVAQAEDASLAAAIAESAAYREAVLNTTRRYKGKPYLYRQGDYMVIGNAQVAAVFRTANNELAGLVDVAHGGGMLAYGDGPLWTMTLANAEKKPAGFSAWEGTEGLVEVASRQAGSTSYHTRRRSRTVQLTLNWDALSTNEEDNILSVQAKVSADAGSPYLRWHITVDNRSSRRGVWQVDFPRLASIMPMGDPAQTGLFLPWGQGRVVENPFALETRFEGQYPAPSAPMQYSAVYGPTGGLFLATHDGNMFMKQFVHECRKNTGTMTYFLRNLPENRGDARVGYRMPYDFVLTAFAGDWFEAARLYREWAIKQRWCAKGPLASRDDVPLWFKQLTFWTIQWEQTAYANWEELKPRIGDKDQTVVDVETIAATMGVPYATHFHGWHKNTFDERVPEYFPPRIGDEGLRAQVRRMQDAGARVIPYVNGCLWDKSLESYTKRDVVRHCIKDAVGNSFAWRIDHTWRYEHGLSDQAIYWLDWPCPYTEFWQAEMADISRKLVADYGFNGVYYDVLSGNGHMCFDPNHGHPTGGGNYWALGNRAVLHRSREAMRAANPEAIMLSEQPSESYIDMLDGFLLYQVQAMPGAVPAFQAVYHDHILLYGNYIGTQPAIDHLPMFAGESLVHGDQLGIFNVWPMFLPDHPRKELSIYWEDEAKRKKNIDFLVHIARLKHNAGYKFLSLGEMQQPLTFINTLPVLEAEQQPWAQGNRTMPAIIHTVWKAPDGTLGLIFCNVSESEQQASYTIDISDYGLPGHGRFVVRELFDNGASRVVGRYQQPTITRTETLPARRALLLEIQVEK
jgi:hypothetical protein